jgi:hypothetical protein
MGSNPTVPKDGNKKMNFKLKRLARIKDSKLKPGPTTD